MALVNVLILVVATMGLFVLVGSIMLLIELAVFPPNQVAASITGRDWLKTPAREGTSGTHNGGSPSLPHGNRRFLPGP